MTAPVQALVDTELNIITIDNNEAVSLGADGLALSWYLITTRIFLSALPGTTSLSPEKFQLDIADVGQRKTCLPLSIKPAYSRMISGLIRLGCQKRA
ncbi:hypothetical protein PoB_001090900 [Plakobranchus ocellatus]|uniref:Uncharacterized protein n=1 Tax=Plakobranchus ocellatus TaxID=259542 RepID=A0AAV3YN14_9GAST|nr:hypothetical protein PoB_001090900 [Plakobranchus ocellatus]